MKVFKKVNEKVKFLYRQNKYVTPRLKRLLCNNILIQLHFDLGCTKQNKCICLCLGLHSHSHIGVIHLQKVNWLWLSQGIESCMSTTVFKYWNKTVPSVVHQCTINGIFKPSYNRYNTRLQMTVDVTLHNHCSLRYKRLEAHAQECMQVSLGVQLTVSTKSEYFLNCFLIMIHFPKG